MALAYEKNVDLAYDTEVFRTCGARYGELATNLRDLAGKLETCLSDLKSTGWTTPAGSTFYELTQTHWRDNIEKYAKLLDTLKETLEAAARDYEDLSENYIEKTKLN